MESTLDTMSLDTMSLDTMSLVTMNLVTSMVTTNLDTMNPVTSMVTTNLVTSMVTTMDTESTRAASTNQVTANTRRQRSPKNQTIPRTQSLNPSNLPDPLLKNPARSTVSVSVEALVSLPVLIFTTG